MLEVASKQRQEAFRWKCSPSARTHLRRSILDKRADMTTADTLSSHRLRRHTALLIKAALCPDAPPENNGEISEREGESSASLGLHPAPEAEAETLAWRTNPAGFVLAQVPAHSFAASSECFSTGVVLQTAVRLCSRPPGQSQAPQRHNKQLQLHTLIFRVITGTGWS